MDAVQGSRKARSKVPRERGPKESVIQAHVMKWLHAQPDVLAWCVKSTGTYDPGRKTFRKPPTWFRAGVPDVHFIVNSIYFTVELKTETGKLSPAQVEFRDAFAMTRTHNMVCTVCRSLDDVVALVRLAREKIVIVQVI